MSHDHHHHHGSIHGRIGVALALNATFTVIELVGAWFTNSTAIAADAVHDLGDSLALGFAWGMEGLAGRSPDATYTYGLRRLSLVGATVNALVLVVGGILVLTETIPRLLDPPEPHVGGMIGLAVLGVVVNGMAAWRVRKGSSLNEQVVSLHLLEDVLGWAAVLVVALIMTVVHLPILDPLLSVAITVWVGFNALRNLRRTLAVFLQAVPNDVDLAAIGEAVCAEEGVTALNHVHVWSHDGERHVLTAQLVIAPTDGANVSLSEALAIQERVRTRLEALGIDHVTLELETECANPNAHCH